MFLKSHFLNGERGHNGRFFTASCCYKMARGITALGRKLIDPIGTGYEIGRGAGQVYEQAQEMQSVTSPGGVDRLAGVKALARQGIIDPAKEAIRATEFTPGKINGKSVKAQIVIPIMFKLS